MHLNLFKSIRRKPSAEVGAERRPVRVLMVDDEPSLTRLTKLNLEETGRYEVRVVNKAREALAAAREFHPDIVLLDIMMPDGNGGDLAADMREDAQLKDLPVVFLTAAVKRSELGSCQGRIGGRTYLAKPVSTEELTACIDKVLASGGSGATLG